MKMGRSTSPDIEENKLFIRGVTDDVDENMINTYFSKYGRVAEVYMARDFETKLPRGFAFVTFEDAKECDDACKSTNGKDFHGKPLHVEKSSKSKSFGSHRGRGFSRGRGYAGRGRSPPMVMRDYGYRNRMGGDMREDRGYPRGRRFMSSRGGRGMPPSPPDREYDYRTRSPIAIPSRSDKYYVDSREKYYWDGYDPYQKSSISDYPSSRSRYEMEYRPRARQDYSPPTHLHRRDYETRAYAPPSHHRDYDYSAASNGRYSPPTTAPPARRDYESREAGSRFINQTYRPTEVARDYGGSSYTSRSGAAYTRGASPPPRLMPRDYASSEMRRGGSREAMVARRGPPRSTSPPPKRIKPSADPLFNARRSSPPPVSRGPSRRF